MAGTSLLTLLDDIATLLDDISLLTKAAAKKTAGVLGDDLALNAEQVSGVRAERELPVVWAVAKGSFINKLILVPAALAISAFLPWLIMPLLMIGGAFLCYEGFEKVAHKLLHGNTEEKSARVQKLQALIDPEVDLVALEKKKIKGAIRTDFILSAEIIVIALGIVKDAPFISQVVVVSLIAMLVTIVVYGLVAGVVKIDDAGLHLTKTQARNAWGDFKRSLGRGLLRLAPGLMKTLTIVGTAAMFLVGGGILVHGFSPLHYLVEQTVELAQHSGAAGGLLAAVTPAVMGGLVGVVAGAVIVALVSLLGRLRKAEAVA